jgi:SAM-dependent methyltransferase
MTGKPAVLRYFDSDRYLHRNPIVPIRATLVSELLADLHGADVLDLGCGDGSVSQPLLAENQVTFVDFSETMLERAKRNTGSVARYVRADALTWEPGKLYDAVLCIGLAAHVESPERLVEKVATLTRSEGRCIIQLTDGGRPLGWLLNRYGRFRRREGYRLRELTGAQLRDLASTHGLTTVTIRRYGLLLPSTGRLPYTWQTWLENMFASRWLATLGAEALVLFKKA